MNTFSLVRWNGLEIRSKYLTINTRFLSFLIAGQKTLFRGNLSIELSDLLISTQSVLLSAQELDVHIAGCAVNKRESQQVLYRSFYGYAMSICNSYANHDDDAMEILNDGFLKVFMEIHRFRPAYADAMSSFKGWLRKIMVYTAIDHFRKNHKHQLFVEYNEAASHVQVDEEDAFDKLSYEEILGAIRHLTPGYRTVFNLFVIEGLSHEEIGKQLSIAPGTSKSNLAKARRQLQKILLQHHQISQRNAV